MKKKLITLLLASSMALMNFASAYGAGDFTDPGYAMTAEDSSDVEADAG